jgi:hypothetical protein
LDLGIRIQVIWFDEDLLELRIQASNGRFEAVADLYAGPSAPSELAASIDGFPRSSDDTREVLLGTLDSKVAGGGVRMRFRCVDLVGHAEVHVEAQQPIGNGPQREVAAFSVPIEPAAVDEFVRQLRHMRLEPGSHAQLCVPSGRRPPHPRVP